jgi:hypothetical protein
LNAGGDARVFAFMLEHTGIGVTDLKGTRRFYEAIATALNVQTIDNGNQAFLFGKSKEAPIPSCGSALRSRPIEAMAGREQHRGGLPRSWRRSGLADQAVGAVSRQHPDRSRSASLPHWAKPFPKARILIHTIPPSGSRPVPQKVKPSPWTGIGLGCTSSLGSAGVMPGMPKDGVINTVNACNRLSICGQLALSAHCGALWMEKASPCPNWRRNTHGLGTEGANATGWVKGCENTEVKLHTSWSCTE